MPPDDTTTIRIFQKLDDLQATSSETNTSVEIIKAAMPHLATHDQVDLKIAQHAAVKNSIMPRPNGTAKKIVAVSAAVVALAGIAMALIQAW